MNIQQFLNDYTAARKLNGTILVAVGDRIVAEHNLGFADVEAKKACQRNTQYQIGSVTKQFTSVVVLKTFYSLAVDSGIAMTDNAELLLAVKNLLHKPISQFLPENLSLWSNKMPAWAQEVTVHQLLQHSSGIPNYTSFTEYKEKFYRSPPDQRELIAYFKDKDLEFAPGSMFAYCNSGYVLLGAIVEQVTKTSLSKYLEHNIFLPLSMTATSFPDYGTVTDLKLNHKYNELARGYEFDVTVANPGINEIKKYLPMQVPGPAGAMISSAPDLLCWNNALFSGKVMPHFLLDLMLDSNLSIGAEGGFYAYGIESKDSVQLGRYYFHAGGIDGYKSKLVYIPKLKVSIVCLTNLVGGGDEFLAETEKINATMPKTLSDKERTTQLKEFLLNKFPLFLQNIDTYNATLFSDELIKELECE